MKTILELVTEIRKAKVDNARAKESMKQALRTERERKLTATRMAIAAILHNEVNGNFGLVVTPLANDMWGWGTLAKISSTAGQTIAFVCVTFETRKFRGSDEVAEEEIEELIIFMARIINGDRLINCSSVEQFKLALANWISEETGYLL